MGDLVELRDLVLEINFEAHGIDVTVMLDGEVPIPTRGIWLTPITEDAPLEATFQRRRPRRVLALLRDKVDIVPIGALIKAPEKAGGCAVTWKVDGHDLQEAHHNRLIVIRQPDEE